MKLIETKTITTKEWLNMLRIAESRIGIDADQDLEKFLVSLFEKTIHEPDYPNAELTDALYFLSKKLSIFRNFLTSHSVCLLTTIVR